MKLKVMKTTKNNSEDSDDSKSDSDTSSDYEESSDYKQSSDSKELSDCESSSDSEYEDQELKNIIFKKINEEFSYGKYGKFTVVMMNKNCYINATHLCNEGDVKFKDWSRNATSQNLLKSLSKLVNIDKDELLIGRNKNCGFKYRGTYAHPKLIPHIASWISSDFAFKVSDIVNKYISDRKLKEKNKIIEEQCDKIDIMSKKIDKVLSNNKELKDGQKELAEKNDKLLKTTDKMSGRIKVLVKLNLELNNKADDITDKLDSACDTRVMSTGKKGDIGHLIVVHNHVDFDAYEDDEDIYDYTVLRIMKNNYTTLIKNHRERYPDMEIILNIDGAPNPVVLWKIIRIKLKKKIDIMGCNFNLNNKYKKKMLIEDIKEIHEARFDYDDL
jgi:hypothetical protein